METDGHASFADSALESGSLRGCDEAQSIYGTLDPSGKGYIEDQTVIFFMTNSGLPQEALAEIWFVAPRQMFIVTLTFGLSLPGSK